MRRYVAKKSQFHCAYDRLRSQYDCLNINLGVISLTSICKLRTQKHDGKHFTNFAYAISSINLRGLGTIAKRFSGTGTLESK